VKSSKIIQIGISLANEEGEVPVPCSTWQFNFKFEEEYEHSLYMYLKRKDAIKPEVLTLLKKAGINFEDLRIKGINPRLFSEYCYGSGLVLNEDLKWIVFHGGFDFGYLI
jgi:CCR4-NOT transcription complex subunit 7/8